jgi:hypothetical protein
MRVLAQDDSCLVDLLGKFAGRHDDERPDLARLAFAEALQDGKHECRGFPGTGLRQPEDVAILEHNRYCFELDGGGRGIARGFDTRHDARVQRKLFELH